MLCTTHTVPNLCHNRAITGKKQSTVNQCVPNRSQDKWSTEINPVRAKIHLHNCTESLQMGKRVGAIICDDEKHWYKFNCSLSVLCLSLCDARDITPLCVLHLRFTLIISIRSAPSMIKCSDSASKHYLASLRLTGRIKKKKLTLRRILQKKLTNDE